MQLGGNANARKYFAQHNCTTTDAQQKYNSRAAMQYREKLAQASAQAMRRYGTKVFLPSTKNKTVLHLDDDPTTSEEQGEIDFLKNMKVLRYIINLQYILREIQFLLLILYQSMTMRTKIIKKIA